ncbi:MAG: hypothetical protein K2I16_02380 [Muribaculaceae bacterium]|nr:hypothetical protein [Muribaculaceae bacterium]
MKRLINIITLFVCLVSALPLKAVTDKEMDHARAIAAKAYLRYANDGSGYLDNINPKSMAELEKALKPKEKENIKAFRNIPVPKDYATWNKQKLVEYWGVTAFSSKGLLDKGRIGRNRAKRNLNAMTVAAPAPRAAAAPESQSQASATPARDVKQPDNNTATNVTDVTTATDTLSAASQSDPLSDPLFADLDSEPQISKAKDHTWVYIIILCILVGVVVALVVFASNVMKKNGEKIQLSGNTPAPSPEKSPDTSAMREKFAATLSAKNEELSALSKKIESLNAQNASLKSNIEGLTAEIASLRTRLAEANKKIAGFEAQKSQVNDTPQQAAKPSPTAPEPQASPRSSVAKAPASQATAADASRQTASPAVRSIYLGRANSKGIFVRADRTLNPGNSIFRLDTTDGYAGSFRVVSNPAVWEVAMLAPAEYLAGACVAPDFINTDAAAKIINDSAGTAIFEGGCWKVIRKAKIHFE